jgi:hypothetical protein
MPLSVEKVEAAIRRCFPGLNQIPIDLDPTLRRMFADSPVIDRERFNIVLSTWKFAPVGKPFFSYYFGEKIDSIDVFIQGLQHFIKDALWHFGDIRRAYAVLAQFQNIGEYIETHKFNLAEFQERLPWTLVENIAPTDRGFLGYVSGRRTYHQQEVLSLSEKILKEIDDHQQDYAKLSSEEVEAKIAEKFNPEECQTLKELEHISSVGGIDLFSYAKMQDNLKKIETAKVEIRKTIEKIEKLKKIGEQNQIHFLRNIEMIDVYVATSMRDDKEYIEMAEFVSRVFGDAVILPLNLRYFDPTLCYCESRIDKGVIECLLVRTAKVTIYCAQEGDTFGKDSELAATLCQGKPVIVYVPTEEKDPKRKAELDKRAQVFNEFHPLGMQVGLYDGVARGVIVVRSPEQCARILSKILTNSLEVDVFHEQHGIVLREKETHSVVRVMTGWGELSHSFWSNFGININPKSGLPE